MLRYQTFLGKVEIREVPTTKTGIHGLWSKKIPRNINRKLRAVSFKSATSNARVTARRKLMKARDESPSWKGSQSYLNILIFPKFQSILYHLHNYLSIYSLSSLLVT